MCERDANDDLRETASHLSFTVLPDMLRLFATRQYDGRSIILQGFSLTE